ncbi:MAG: glycosyltransferase [Elusimicrobia bacterium]|nr:glycosyltransferase [Elusimicrobiota bacterium]
MPALCPSPIRTPDQGRKSCLDAGVIILCSRPEALDRCLESLSRQQDPSAKEVLLVLNSREEECSKAAFSFRDRLAGLKILRGDRLSLGQGRNRALAEAESRWLCFFDDDVVVPPGYFTRLSETLRLHPEAAVLGGPDRTPSGSSLFQRSVGHVLDSPLGSGPIRRHGRGFPDRTWTDDRGFILCNLVLDREALMAGGWSFDEELVRNEENLLLARLLASGKTALHDPGLFVFHERRPDLPGFCRQCFLSGWGRLQMTLKSPGSLRPFHLGPLLASACVLGSLFMPAVFFPVLTVYSLACLANGLLLLSRHPEEPLSALTWLFCLVPSAHLCYAAGLLAGAWDRLSRQQGPRQARS